MLSTTTARTRTRLAAVAAAAVALAPLAAVTTTTGAGAAAGPVGAAGPGAATAGVVRTVDARAVLPTARGFSFGSTLTGNALARSGRTAFSAMCTRTYPNAAGNDVASSQPALEDLADLGVVEARNRSSRIDGRPAMTSTSRIARASLLGGVVQLRGIESFSRVVKNANGTYTGTSRARLAGLRIGGEPVPLPEPTETERYALPGGRGELAFNLRGVKQLRGGARAYNLALRLTLPDGTKLQLARSQAELSSVDVGIYRGGAWGSDVPTVLELAGSGRTGFVPMPCRGTEGKVRDNDTARVDLGGQVGLGATVSSVQTKGIAGGGAQAIAASEVAEVSLGGGQLTIDAVEARATVTRGPNGRITGRQPFSRVLGLTVGGEPQTLPVDGQDFEIPGGIARLQSGIVDRTDRGLKVVGLRITLLPDDGPQVVVNLGNAAAYIVR